MIKGVVNARREAIVDVEIMLPNGESVVQAATVDTGFSGFLSLSAETVAELELSFTHKDVFVLADEREEEIALHQAVVSWDGEARDVYVLASGLPLVGMALLDGYRLTLDVVDGRLVTIEKRQGEDAEA